MSKKIVELLNPEQMTNIAGRLDELEKLSRVDGRPLIYVQSIIRSLRDGNLVEAKSVALREGDKLQDLPPIKRIVIDELFAGTVDESLIPLDFGN